MHKRTLGIIFITVLVICLLIGTDPDLGLVQHLPIGAGTIITLTFLLKGVLGVVVLHFSRKFFLNYAISDFEELGKIATKSPEGAGSYAIAIAIMILAFAIILVGSFAV